MIKTIIGRGLIWILMTVVSLAVWPILLEASNMAPDPVSSFIITWLLPVFWIGLTFLIWTGRRFLILNF